MKKIIVTVLGWDRPGIVAAVARTLYDFGCNIEDISQTILQTEFAAIFIAAMPDETKREELRAGLEDRLHPMGLEVHLKDLRAVEAETPLEAEPFVITTIGPDRQGLVSGVTELLAEFKINIAQLKAAFRGGDDPYRNIMIYEIDIPSAVDRQAFRDGLYQRGRELGIEVSLQHRDIFEQIYRI